MTERAQELVQRWRRLSGRRSLWLRHWDDLARVQLSRRLGFVSEVQEGERRNDEIFDGTGMQSSRALANALGGMLRPEGQPWFFIKPVEDADERTDEAQDWFADTENRMREALDDPRARFRQATGEADIDLVVFGTAVMFINEIVGASQLLFQSVWLKDAVPFFGETGSVEGVFRSRWLTLRQAINKWGREQLSEEVRKMADDRTKMDEKLQFLFAVVPRAEGRADALINRNLPVANIVIEIETSHEVVVGGFNEFPYVVPRWDTMSGEDYGRSPGMIALPDVNTSQAMGETMLIAGQRSADPSLLAPSDSFIDAPNTFPGGMGYYEADAVRDLGGARNAIFPLEPGSNFPITRDMQQDTREQIRLAFLLNLFNLPVPGEATMTATEVIARQQEFIREMGPVFGRLETDYTAPMVERVFNIMLRANALLPIPDVLQGRSVRFEYESPVKKIREQSGALAAQEWVSQHIQAANEAERPDILDNVDFDAWSAFSAEAANLPHQLRRGAQQVEAARQQRAEQEQEQAQLAAAAQVAASAKDAGSAIQSLQQ